MSTFALRETVQIISPEFPQLAELIGVVEKITTFEEVDYYIVVINDEDGNRLWFGQHTEDQLVGVYIPDPEDYPNFTSAWEIV